jgi:hypothetical protein
MRGKIVGKCRLKWKRGEIEDRPVSCSRQLAGDGVASPTASKLVGYT